MLDKIHASRKDLLWYLQVILYGSLILYLGKSLFIPLSFAVLISFVLYPVCRWMETKGVGRLWAIVLALLLLLLLTLALLALLASQMISFLSEWPVIQVKLQQAIVNMSAVLADVFNIGVARQKEIIANIANQSGAGILNLVKVAVTSSLSSLVLFVLIPVYVVLILLYRHYWMKVLGRLFPNEPTESLREIVGQSVEAYFKFIRGMLVVYLVVGCLNSIGLAVLGVPNAILFGLIASVLTIVPYVGIMAGALLPMAVAWVTYDSVWYPLGVVGIFAAVQYLEANVIFPFAVSHRLNINTLVMLLVILAGGIIWGIAGMILFVPFAGIVKLVADRNPKWKSVSMMLGTENDASG